MQLKHFLGHLERLHGEIEISTGTGGEEPRKSFFDLESYDHLRCGAPTCDGTLSLSDLLFEMDPLKVESSRTYRCPGFTGAQSCRRTFSIRVTALEARDRKQPKES